MGGRLPFTIASATSDLVEVSIRVTAGEFHLLLFPAFDEKALVELAGYFVKHPAGYGFNKGDVYIRDWTQNTKYIDTRRGHSKQQDAIACKF